MTQPRHLELVVDNTQPAAQTRTVSGGWTLVAMFAGAMVGSSLAMQAGVPWPDPMSSGPGGDIDLIAGMAVGAAAGGFGFSAFVRRVMGAAFEVPNWLREFTQPQADLQPIPVRTDNDLDY